MNCLLLSQRLHRGFLYAWRVKFARTPAVEVTLSDSLT